MPAQGPGGPSHAYHRDRYVNPTNNGVRQIRGRTAQVFINLMTNARKYCDAERPELRIRTRSDAGLIAPFPSRSNAVRVTRPVTASYSKSVFALTSVLERQNRAYQRQHQR